MVEIIASDFEVKLVTQNDQNSLLAAPKNVFVHFVFLHQQLGYNELNNFMYIVLRLLVGYLMK
jgi:hypothetical protein